MMAQSDSNEDSQGRQLRVSKKLSKAISSVPRSRFIKPRPNLPGSKRPESNSTPSSVHKPVETSQKTESRNTAVLESQKKGKEETLLLNANEASKIGDEKSTELLNAIKILEVYNYSPSTDCRETIFEKEQRNTVSKIDKTLPDENKVNSTVLNIDERIKKEDNKKTSILNSEKLLETGDNINTELLTNKIVKEQYNAPTPALSTNETVQKDATTHIAITEPSPNPPEQEKNDITNISASVTDRSSKYPHLTSILSKKRTEPKKEVQHKKRKKFKKGDVAPERSKMTMADLIYWNPTGTDQSSVKTVANMEEIASINEEEECIDGAIEESNICDSVPKLVISEDGQINIDQTSLIVSRNVPQPTSTEVVRKDETTYSSFRKRPLTKHWSVKDTTIFYKALSLVGTDFGLMETIFPHRTRRELKQKFKREEKCNIDLINRAMYETHLTFDANTLEELIQNLNNGSNSESENVDDDFRPAVKAKTTSKSKKKVSTKPKCINDDELSDSTTEYLPDEMNEKEDIIKKRRRSLKKLPDDFVDSSVIEDTAEMDFEETNKNVIEKEVINKEKRRRVKKLPDDFVDSGVIEDIAEMVCEETSKNDTFLELTLNRNTENCQRNNDPSTPNAEFQDVLCLDENVYVDLNQSNAANANNNVSQLSFSSSNEEYVTIEYIENVDAASDSTLLSNVMAYEVVTSQMPLAKKKRKVQMPTIPEKKPEACLPLLLSSTNYTPS